MAEDSNWGQFEDNQAWRPGLDLSLQSAAEGGLPTEIRLQQFQQEPDFKGLWLKRLGSYAALICFIDWVFGFLSPSKWPLRVSSTT